jgi:hypothetical protein
MFNDLPKIIGRGFVLGFLLPSTLFCLYLQLIGLGPSPLPKLEAPEDALKLTPIVLSSIVSAVLLMALNRAIIRILEGYGSINPFKSLERIRRDYFKKNVEPIFNEYEQLGLDRKKDPDVKKPPEFALKVWKNTLSYPHRVDLVLGTKFGNAMRAFEIYPQDVYGIEGITMWPRLFFILPKPVQDDIRDGRAVIDFNANLFVLSLVAIACNAVKMYYMEQRLVDVGLYFVLPAVAAVYSWIALPQSAQEWGESFKASFDLYRGKLAKQLGLELPSNAELERKMWRHISRTITYRSDWEYSLLDDYRSKPIQRGAKPGPRKPNEDQSRTNTKPS